MIFRSRKFWKFGSCVLAVGIVLIIISNFQPIIRQDNKNKIILEEVPDFDEVRLNDLVNFTQFQYKIKSTLCNNFDKELLGVIIVTSYVGHDGLRSSHRQAIPQAKLNEMGLIRVFLLADIPQKEKFINTAQILHESKKFNDIIQGNFQEAYRNLTYKHIMGLKWAALDCSKAKFVIKIDDDIVFDIFQIKNYLENLEIEGQTKDFIAGYILDNKLPIRVKANKWYVSRDEFAGDLYPDYISGWLYITNPKTALKLVLESQREKFFWIDDTYVTGILRTKINVPLIRLNKWFSANAEFIDCCVRDLKLFSYECEYFVGPNGGDNKLIIEFVHNVEKCYFDECSKRPAEKSLKNTCIGEAKNLLQDHGEALVRAVKLG